MILTGYKPQPLLEFYVSQILKKKIMTHKSIYVWKACFIFLLFRSCNKKKMRVSRLWVRFVFRRWTRVENIVSVDHVTGYKK